MKKVRIILSVLAIVLAIGGAIASAFTPNTIAYEYVTNPEPDCLPKSIVCQVPPTSYPCRLVSGGVILREHEDFETECGDELWRTTPPPNN